MVDFDAEVLADCFEEFAIPVTLIAPDASESEARGILDKKPQTDDVGFLDYSRMATTLDLRTSELTAIPGEGWRVRIGTDTYRIPQAPVTDVAGRLQAVLTKV